LGDEKGHPHKLNLLQDGDFVVDCLGWGRKVDDVERGNKLPGARELRVRGARPHPHFSRRGCGAPPLLEVEVSLEGLKLGQKIIRGRSFITYAENR